MSENRQPTPIGLVASPPRLESTSEVFHFWIEREKLVEKSQIVRTSSIIGGQKFEFFGIIEEVRRQSRNRDIAQAFDRADGLPLNKPTLDSEGVTYASVQILSTVPDVLTPPLEESEVFLGNENDAAQSYGFDGMNEPLILGRLRNGGAAFAGNAQIDLDYLLGNNGGHLNVTGMTGAGTKSSFLLTVLKVLLHKAQNGPNKTPLFVVPIVLNVKGEDLMWIDQKNKEFQPADEAEWQALGVPAEPFTGAAFWAPNAPNKIDEPDMDGCKAGAYYWSPRDVLEGDLFRFLFDASDASERMMALVLDIEAHFTNTDGKIKSDAPQTWDELRNWLRAYPNRQRFLWWGRASVPATERKMRARRPAPTIPIRIGS